MKRKIFFAGTLLSLISVGYMLVSAEDSSIITSDLNFGEGGVLGQVSTPSNVFPVMEKEVIIKPDALTTYSDGSDGSITQEEVKNRMMSPNPDEQPTFSDIVFLQLKTITNLIAMLNKFNTQDVSKYFATSADYNYYQTWVQHFANYGDKQQFVDAFSGGVSLKDIGIGNDIIDGLSKRVLCEYKGGTCSQKVTIIKKDKYAFYTMEDIVNSLFYKDQQKIGDTFIEIYNSLTDLNGSIAGLVGAQKTFVEQFLAKLFSDSIINIELDDYDIGYGLKVRLDNLNAIKQGFINKQETEKINLLGVYNFYYEINNIVKGSLKGSDLKIAIETNNLELFMANLAKMDTYELMDMKGEKLNSLITNSLDLDCDTCANSSQSSVFSSNGKFDTIEVLVSADPYSNNNSDYSSCRGTPRPKFNLEINRGGIGQTKTSNAMSDRGNRIKKIFTGESVNNLRIKYTNNCYEGSNKNRNLYIKSFSLNGKQFFPSDGKYYLFNDPYYTERYNLDYPYLYKNPGIELLNGNGYLEFDNLKQDESSAPTYSATYNCSFNPFLWFYTVTRYGLQSGTANNCQMKMSGGTIVYSPIGYGSYWFAKCLFDSGATKMYKDSNGSVNVIVDVKQASSMDGCSNYFNLGQ